MLGMADGRRKVIKPCNRLWPDVSCYASPAWVNRTLMCCMPSVKVHSSKVKACQLSRSPSGFDTTAQYSPKDQVHRYQFVSKTPTDSCQGAYKLPGFSDIPQVFNVSLLRDAEWPNLGSIKVWLSFI